ncbi:asparagine synthase-related protein [Longimicrobium sp.]|uniref:asparagine synthase-related protein n=1 Tax=Longimicrobium sp. TaxID=2029185 RepID=UPI002E32C875|nr:asparagine synthase-related protein [Longimicrobium sp.]HEX6039062.1 asparagine synthase-related protein [Longimicrobium sp.]
MSDFLFSSRRRPPAELKRILERWIGPVAGEYAEWTAEWGTLATARAPYHPDPAWETARSLSILVGEPLARVDGMIAGPALESARRESVHRLLVDGAADRWADWLDGPFAAIALDDASGGTVATDLFGWIPLFAAEVRDPEPRLVIGTHVDAVAEAAGLRGEIDPVSAVEMMGYFTIAPPRTLYPGVTQMAPGCTRRFGIGGWTTPERVYWQPVERTDFASLDDAAEALRIALVTDVELAVDVHRRVGMLLSGGEDSRAVLGAVPREVEVRGFIYTEADNREVRSARRVARAYGARLRWEPRPPMHDLRHFETVAALVGTQNEFIDVHGYGLAKSMGIDQLPVVLGGFSSDALLKADNVTGSSRRRVLRGESPGIRAAEPPQLPGIRPELLRAAAERRDAFRRRLAEIRPESAEEWSYIYPFTMRKYASGFHGNRRLFRGHEPFQSNAVVRVAAGVPQAWKMERRLFARAMRPLLAPSWWVPHSRNRMPYFPQPVNAVARPLLGLARDLRALATGTMGANQESWPVWEQFVRAPEMDVKAREHAIADSPLGALFEAADPEQAMRDGWKPLRRLAALQLAWLTRR